MSGDESFVDGWCYLRMVKSGRREAWQRLGSWPRLQSLMEMPGVDVVASGELFALGASVDVALGSVHIKPYFSTVLGDVPLVALLLACVDLRPSWPAGSVGSVATDFAREFGLEHWLGEKSWVGGVSLGLLVGGEVGRPLALPIRPVDEQSRVDVMCYNLALFSYYSSSGSVLVEDLSFVGSGEGCEEWAKKIVEKNVNRIFPDSGVVSSSESVGSGVSGRLNGTGGSNVERNRIWRKEKRDRKRRRQELGLSRGQGSSGRGFFSLCSEETQVRLRESRAEMLVAKNILEKQKVEEQVKRANVRTHCRLLERQVEVERLKIEADVEKFSGFAETVVSGSMSPSGSSSGENSPLGTISPNSSISVAEENRIRRRLSELENEVKVLKIDNSDAEKRLKIASSFEDKTKELEKKLKVYTDANLGKLNAAGQRVYSKDLRTVRTNYSGFSAAERTTYRAGRGIFRMPNGDIVRDSTYEDDGLMD